MQTGVMKEVTGVEVKVAFGVVVAAEEDVIGFKFIPFQKPVSTGCKGAREVNCASRNLFADFCASKMRCFIVLLKFHFIA